MRASIHATFAAVIALALVACVPKVDIDPSLVASERVLAVRAEPAEAAPGATITLTALVAAPDGPVADAPLDWAACTARLPLAEPGPVANACVAGAPDAVDVLPMGPVTTLTLDADACRLFGPDPPPAMQGQPNGRPVDPDSTGGYAQPLRVALPDGSVALALVRLSCGVSGATQAQAAELRQRYHANTHPSLSALVATHEDGGFQDVVDGVPLHVAPGEHLSLTAGWPDCPIEDTCGDGVCGADEDRTACAMDCARPVGCEGAERFARFDASARAVVVQRESIRVSWATTLGRFDEPRTGRAGTDPSTSTTNTWTAPSTGSGWIWLVTRDDRGGVSWRATAIVVDAP